MPKIMQFVRRLPRKRNKRQVQMIQATEEWFGEMNPVEMKSSVRIALFLMGRRKGIELGEEEQQIAWCVHQNLVAESHQASLSGT